MSTEQSPPVDDSAAETAVDLDWLTLDDGEEVLWASTPHKSSLVPALLIGVPLSLVLIGIPILVGSYLTYKNSNFVVTTRGLYRKQGILSRDVKQIGFDKVQNISYSQTAVGARLGYGSVEISTAGSSGVELRFQNIPNPSGVQELISREIERREGSSRDEDGDVDAVLDEILAELQGIRQALDQQPDTEAPPAIGTETASGTPETEDSHPPVDAVDGDDSDPIEPATTEPADDQ